MAFSNVSYILPDSAHYPRNIKFSFAGAIIESHKVSPVLCIVKGGDSAGPGGGRGWCGGEIQDLAEGSRSILRYMISNINLWKFTFRLTTVSD